jgi:hypothetical protein
MRREKVNPKHVTDWQPAKAVSCCELEFALIALYTVIPATYIPRKM